MAELEYGRDALNVKSRFYRASCMFYVEGADDEVFWTIVATARPELSIQIESVGSCTQLDKLISKIESGEINAVAARDRDYLEIKKLLSSSKRVVYTSGYSIENTLVNSTSLASCVADMARKGTRDDAHADAWISEFSERIREILHLDVAGQLSERPVAIIGHSCDGFMKSKNSFTLCEDGIRSFIGRVGGSVALEKLNTANNELQGCDVKDVIRGHFLFSAVHRYVQVSARAFSTSNHVSLSHDALFALLISHFRQMFKRGHPEYSYYTTAMRRVAKEFA